MSESKPYLYGGTFFLLLLHIKTDAITKKEHRNGVVGNNNQDDLMLSMIKVYYPGFVPMEYFEKEVSLYRSCEKSATTRTKNLPFGSNQKHLIEAFDQKVKNEYSTVLDTWHTTVTHRLPYSSNEDMKWLIRQFFR